ncbi:MAG: hypothetical protein JSR74_12540 [Proteobacteria bacterium]|nr:hypothetical protein [Pseudomonadota bacterium]
MTFRVTHVDMHRRRRRMDVRNVPSRAAAVAWVEQLYGDGFYIAAIRIVGA